MKGQAGIKSNCHCKQCRSGTMLAYNNRLNNRKARQLTAMQLRTFKNNYQGDNDDEAQDFYIKLSIGGLYSD